MITPLVVTSLAVVFFALSLLISMIGSFRRPEPRRVQLQRLGRGHKIRPEEVARPGTMLTQISTVSTRTLTSELSDSPESERSVPSLGGYDHLLKPEPRTIVVREPQSAVFSISTDLQIPKTTTENESSTSKPGQSVVVVPSNSNLLKLPTKVLDKTGQNVPSSLPVLTNVPVQAPTVLDLPELLLDPTMDQTSKLSAPYMQAKATVSVADDSIIDDIPEGEDKSESSAASALTYSTLNSVWQTLPFVLVVFFTVLGMDTGYSTCQLMYVQTLVHFMYGQDF